ncbi:MAG: helix-turn-helix domain-containing protein [Gemmatimonadetes bacterium]|nr:helix-turn-helix domain-containing protein [Gemmatimonadota bacterium]
MSAKSGTFPNGAALAELDAWRQLTTSATVREQQVAFTCATGVPLTLLPASAAPGALFDEAFCVKGCLGSPSGDVCREKVLRAEQRALRRLGPTQYSCPSGLLKIIVPVFIGGRHAGSLLAGPFSVHALEGARLAEQVERLEKQGLGDRVSQLRTTWRHTPLISAEKCRAAGTLLRMFARYLEESGKRTLQKGVPASSPLLRKIEAFLAESQDSRVSLKEVAARVNLSPCHFCAVFKKQTGLTFTEYRTQQRLEKAQRLLHDPERRVSDVAFAAGFESIPYFNRAFRRRFGCSPSEFRLRLAR